MKLLDYETLATLPLFMGMDGAMLSAFYKTAAPAVSLVRIGGRIAVGGDECRSLTMLVEGNVTASLSDPRGRFVLDEYVTANCVVEPQRLFGLHPTYTRTYTAATACRVMRLPKQTVVTQLLDNEVFRLNFMNLLCANAQQFEARLFVTMAPTVGERLAAFVLRHSLRPVGEKCLRVRMTDLADILATSRAAVSHALRELAERGLVEYTRGSILIPSPENLLAAVR